MTKRIVIIGAGPTGLGAARRLRQLEHHDFTVYETLERPGGLSRSFIEDGFTWDIGGHVVFSHFADFDQLLEELLGDRRFELERKSFIRILDGWTPYPFQNNIRHLPPAARLECLMGLYHLAGQQFAAPANFREWCLQAFGEGIAKYFMFPQNFKVWATPLEQMSSKWIADRVSMIDFERVLSNVVHERDDVGWGPNNSFCFPERGGTGAIYDTMATSLHDAIRYRAEVQAVDLEQKVVQLADGSEDHFDHLISTMPLDLLVKRLTPRPEALDAPTSDLKHSGTLIVGVGLEKPLGDDRCWMYFPEGNSPFYRATNFARYSRYNVPGGDTGRFSSFMCETSYSPHKPEDASNIVERTIDGLIATGLMEPGDRERVVTTFLFDADYSYPTPTLGRDAALSAIQPFLEEHGIHSRGRFGAWRYEVGNMDHSVQMGIEIIDRLLQGKEETVIAEQHG